jgi:hypothetical protein
MLIPRKLLRLAGLASTLATVMIATTALQSPDAGSAQKSDSKQPPQAIRVTTRLVQVSVVVHDKHGNPIPGLTKDDIRGEWILMSIYRTPNISGISPEQAKSLVGSRIKYENGWLIACKQRVKIEKVDEREVSAAQFLAGRKRTHFSDVEVYAPSIKEITINGNSSGNCFDTYALPGEDVYVKSRDELLIDFDGVYYRALRRAAGGSPSIPKTR